MVPYEHSIHTKFTNLVWDKIHQTNFHERIPITSLDEVMQLVWAKEKEGWELVQFYPNGYGGFAVVMKRPVSEEPE